MPNYHYQTDEFGISDTRIHLLRSGFNYSTISFSEIKEIRISQGFELRNWIAIFLIGVILMIVGMYLSLSTANVLINGDVKPVNARMILFLFIPCVGALFILPFNEESSFKLTHKKKRSISVKGNC